MRNYKFLTLFLLLLLFSATAFAQGEDEIDFRLLNDDFELTLEVGPAFLENPVFKQRGILHPAIKVNYDQPRYIGAAFGWRFNDYLFLQLGINFTSADFKSSSDVGQRNQFDNLLTSFFKYQTRESQTINSGTPLSAPLSSQTCEDNVISIYCASRIPIVSELQDDFILNSNEFGNYFSVDCDRSCALTAARAAITIDEAGNRTLIENRVENQFLIQQVSANFESDRAKIRAFSVDNCGADCESEEAIDLLRTQREQNPLLREGTYNQFIEAHSDYQATLDNIKAEIDKNNERCFTSCAEERARERIEDIIRMEGQTALDQANDKIAFLVDSPEYDTAGTEGSVCADITNEGGKASCQRVEAERLILMRGDTRLADAQTESSNAIREHVETQEAYTDGDCAEIEDEDERVSCAVQVITSEHTTGLTTKYNDWLDDSAEYRDALDGDCNGDESCALAQAQTDIFDKFLNGRTEEEIRIDEAGLARLETIGDDDAIAINRALASALENVAITPATTTSAGGTFLSVGSFFNIYGNYPITNWISAYGGGGAGFVWTKIDKGLITRSASLDLRGVDLSTIADSIVRDLDLSSSIGDDIETALNSLTRSHSVERRIDEATLSYAVSAGFGIRTEVFEGLVLDTGYHFQWNPDLYADADSKLIHQLKFGFVFKF